MSIEKDIESITKGTSLKVLLESSYSGTHIIESIAKGTNLKVWLELSYSRKYNYIGLFFWVVVEGIKKMMLRRDRV